MKILIVDDEKYLCEDLHDALERVSPGNEYAYANEYESAMEQIKTQSFDIAFLDIQMPGKNGLTLAEDIKRLKPEINIIMVTAYAQYALDALKLFVSGYILKPVMDDELKEALSNLRNPVETAGKRLKVKCFGNFEVFENGKPFPFKRKKEKELLAYLICLKGASASRGEICASIFEESDNISRDYSYLRTLVSTLNSDLQKLGYDGVFLHSNNTYSVNTALIDCDYYNFLTGKADKSDSYSGEFMNQYSWAESYIYSLENY